MSRKAKPTVKVNAYAIMSRAVEEGVEYGWNRAHKHFEKQIGEPGKGTAPTPEKIREEIVQHVLNAVCEVLVFND